jgi:hypothetical protein
MRLPSSEGLRELIAWEPPHGVLSVYLEIDPGDRGGGWRVELRDQLDEITAAAKDNDDRELRAAIEATITRVADHFQPQATPSGRIQIGFVEVTAKPGRDGREQWFAVQHPVVRTRVVHAPRPYLRTLAEILDGGRPRAVAALSSERVRLFEWRLGTIEAVAEHELVLLEKEWRERKAPQLRDPASGQGVGSTGRDQHDQRLDQHRKRFLKECGARASAELGEEARRELLCIGEPGLCEAFLAGWDSPPSRIAVDPHDVIAEPTQAIAERASAKFTELDAERGAELAEKVIGAASSPNGAGALGPSDTARALARGQIEHLLIDVERPVDEADLDDEVRSELEAVLPQPAGRFDEWIVEAAIRTSATITALRDEAAERLAEYGGVAGLLRY